MLCIQELGHFGYTQLSVSLRPSLSSCVCIKIFNILNQKTRSIGYCIKHGERVSKFFFILAHV